MKKKFKKKKLLRKIHFQIKHKHSHGCLVTDIYKPNAIQLRQQKKTEIRHAKTMQEFTDRQQEGHKFLFLPKAFDRIV